MAEENRKIELRSEEVEDILGKVPGWVTRNGIVMLFAIVAILLLGAWMFKVPDVKKAEIYVTSLQPPANIEARTDGKVEQLLVTDNEKVEVGQVLAVIENPADFEDVQNLSAQIRKLFLPADTLPELNLPVNGNADLGPIQPVYAAFYKNYRDYREFLQLDYHQRKIELLLEEYEKYLAYSENLDVRAATLREEYELYQKQYQRDSILFRQGVVSESDYENTKSEMLSRLANWQEMLSLKAENDIQTAGIREQILEMELRQQEQVTSFSTLLEENLNKLVAEIATWRKQYLIIAPIEGQVTFNQIWSENQNVKAGEKVMTIVPEQGGVLIGKIQLPMQGAGEVDEGDQVNIKFDSYPYLEYGMVRGRVGNVSKVPQDNFYTVEVILPDGLTTFYGIEIGFNQNMVGEAEILTDKMRLLQRIFNPVRSAVTRQRAM
ncbi:MAG: HlyD family efflux transporter periplasmic adaptor subunit [Bacteroidales bacterium]|nr:HlyD family efflux transporter periplasmic adaptor subunit [Bacteroidales bacterium]MDT8429922.1 HlyD family efflux transporter periplasmic adaptor subunit [Bacteroidales bacterium]